MTYSGPNKPISTRLHVLDITNMNEQYVLSNMYHMTIKLYPKGHLTDLINDPPCGLNVALNTQNRFATSITIKSRV